MCTHVSKCQNDKIKERKKNNISWSKYGLLDHFPGVLEKLSLSSLGETVWTFLPASGLSCSGVAVAFLESSFLHPSFSRCY
jgi:hypothetical protein